LKSPHLVPTYGTARRPSTLTAMHAMIREL
jgi:hypothetical protein